MPKRKAPPRPLPNPRTKQQPPAQSGADLIRVLGALIPAAGPLQPERASDVDRRQSKGRGKGQR